MKTFLSLFFVLFTTSARAQDPAEGWMAYAVGSIPDKYERITKLQMTWTVGAKPRRSFAFFSPWFGMDPSDNLNLIQPVNPWSGGEWSMYTEYFQWSPEHNSNSEQYSVEAGQNLTGSLLYDESTDSYELTQTIVETGDSSSQTVKCQNGKKYTVPYVVYEKVFSCRDYPPDGIVVFRNIVSECDGEPCTIEWTPKVKDPNCEMAAHWNKDANEVSITWNTDAESVYDFHSAQELFELNYHGWAANVPTIRSPADACLDAMAKVCPNEEGKGAECEACIRRHNDTLGPICAHTGSGRKFCGVAKICEDVHAVFADMHDGDQKEISVVGGELVIKPHGNNESWAVRASIDDNCRSTVDFDVPGKPNPPPVSLSATFWRSSDASGQHKKLNLEFTDPSGTLAPPDFPLNAWIEIDA